MIYLVTPTNPDNPDLIPLESWLQAAVKMQQPSENKKLSSATEDGPHDTLY